MATHASPPPPVIATRRGSFGCWPTQPSAYTIEEEIGGSHVASTRVCLATCSATNTDVAIKIQDLDKSTSDELSRAQKEVQRMSELVHPNLVQFHTAFVARGELWVVLQLHAAGCCEMMADLCPTGFEEPAVACILHEVLNGLGYLHRHDIIHRQLRSSNILIDSQGAVRLTDFGLSGHLVEHGERRSQRQTFVRGGIGWMAPEVLEQAQGYDSSADVWALGISAIELISGRAPFSNMPPLKVMLEVLQGEVPEPDTGSKHLRDLVASCLHRDPRKRPAVPKLLQASVGLGSKSPSPPPLALALLHPLALTFNPP
jgi:serine/threonine-protein kinase OSR1/STK39